MKKILVYIGLFFGLSMSIFAGKIDVVQLNEQISNLLTPLQNDTTSAAFKFNDINIDEYRVNSLSVSSHYLKKLGEKYFGIDLANLQYNYNDGKTPTATLVVAINTDFTQIFPQVIINEIIPNAAEMIETIARAKTGDVFGDALSIQSMVTSMAQDSDNNYTGLTAIISAKIDLKSLPENLPLDEVVFTDLVLSLTMNVKTGLQLNGYVLINPEFKDFQKDEVGLKEMLEKLIASDPEMIEALTGYIFALDQLATEMLENDFVSQYLGKYVSIPVIFQNKHFERSRV